MKTLIGLNTYFYEFDTQEEMIAKIEELDNKYHGVVTEVFINNKYGFEYNTNRVIST